MVLRISSKSSLRPAYVSWARTTVENTVSNSTSIVARALLRREPVSLQPLPRNGSTRYNNIEMDLNERGWEGVDYIYKAHGKAVP
jgi:hypothetical protein